MLISTYFYFYLSKTILKVSFKKCQKIKETAYLAMTSKTHVLYYI